MAKKTVKRTTPPAASRTSATAAAHPPGGPRLYTLAVFIIGGMITEAFAKKNPVIGRTIQIRGDQTLQDFHGAIFRAFGRSDAHMYEFQVGGKGPSDPKARRYVLPGAYEMDMGGTKPAGRVDQTTIDALGLKKDQAFAYWFDFGDDWWHQINVEAIEDVIPKGKFPKVTAREGANPPQYPDMDEE